MVEKSNGKSDGRAELKEFGVRAVIDRADFGALLTALGADGRKIIGPTVRDGAVIYDEIERVEDLPIGWKDEQSPGRYRLVRAERPALFDYVVGPQSWKKILHPPQVRLWSAKRDGDGFTIDATPPPSASYAFLGVRGCEMEAIARLDRVFLGGEYVDSTYERNRNGLLLVAINCGRAGGTCFCTSMGTGPRVGRGYDLVLTELIDEAGHRFLLESGSERGAELLAGLPVREAMVADLAAAESVVAGTAASMGRKVETAGLRELLNQQAEHPVWDEVAQRCLTCANCTMVCPTCFCSTVEDVTDLTGDHAERWRKWDSCFTMDFSHLHGGSIRQSTRARYRQWLTHKLSSWIDQFGESGCVGCGRCIAWCPVGIDLTAEIRAIREVPATESGAESNSNTIKEPR
jgi:sulfhydrogenase subunit beta (sulfur reductase)